jgi:DNA repair exonuclease SbcCD nuclease subunit
MFRFVHAADLHLDSPLLGLERYEGAPVSELRGATRRALRELVGLAIRDRAAFVLIAGDVFDGDWPDFNTGLFFVREMARLREAGIRVALVRGNHDAESQITKSLPLPDNVIVFDARKPESVVWDDLRVAVHGQSFTDRTMSEDLAAGYPKAIPGFFNIGVLHTSLDGRPGHANYAPTRLDVLRSKGYDYWALGHVHAREVVYERPRVVFPGNTQGRHARETGPKGCELVTVEDGEIQAEFVALDSVRWAHLHLPVGDTADREALLAAVYEQLREASRGNGDRLLAVHLTVEGAGPLYEAVMPRLDAIEADIRALALDIGPSPVWIEKIRFRLHPAFDRNQAAARPDAVGEILRQVDALSASQADLGDLARDALGDLMSKLPPEAREGVDSLRLDEPEILARLLADAEGILIARLQETVRS